MDFSIIIVSWNVKDRLRANLQALADSQGESSCEIIVVDNASHDGTAAMVQSEFPTVRLIANQENQGFAKACNQGMREAQEKVFILLNPDMRVQPTTLSHLKQWLTTNPQADVVGIKLVDEQGTLVRHVRRFPKWTNQLAIILKLPHIFPAILHHYLQIDFNYEAAAAVEVVRGAFFVLPRRTVERFGYLDERYFLWFEEVDYCRTVHEQGGQVWYTPVAQAEDFVGQSFAQVSRPKKQAYFRDSMLTYFKKWHAQWQVVILQLAWEVAEALVWYGEKANLKSRTKT